MNIYKKKFIHIKNRLINRIGNTTIFVKLIITFIVIIIVPQTITYYISETTLNQLIVGQISSETMNSIQLISESVDSLLKKMSSIALYVNEDKSIKELIIEEMESLTDDPFKDPETENLKILSKINRINKFNSFLSNIDFNMMGTKCYITIITQSGQKYSNWAYNGQSFQLYYNEFISSQTLKRNPNLIWRGIEKNYIESDVKEYPYVFTLAKNIYDSKGEIQYGTFFISVPEMEFSKLMTTNNEQQKRVILDENMNILASTVKPWLDLPFNNFLDCRLPAGPQGYFIAKDEHEDLIISYNTIRNLKIVDIKSYSSITKQFSMNRNNLLMINMIFALFFIIISAIIAREISKPLRRLANIMLTTDFEKFDSQQIGTRNDEVGILEKSFHIMRNNIKILMEDNVEKERKKRESEIKLLQAQISPHFLFNTLNTIRWAAINNNMQKVSDMVLALSNLLRMTIVKGDELITVEEEIQNVKSYADIFQMRHSIAFKLICEIDEETKKYKIPKLLLQPLVENAIVHGLEGIQSEGLIELTSSRQGGFVVLYVKDNGIGMDLNSLIHKESKRDLKFSGIGTRNVDERIKLYFGPNYGLKIKSEVGKGTVIELWLPDPSMLER